MKKTKKQSRSKGKITIPDCNRFTGYKPCFPDTTCLEKCVNPKPFGKQILIINLEAMGNVLVTTSLLPAIKRKYSKSTIHWITMKNSYMLLQGNPYIDKVYQWDPESWLALQAARFDVIMNVDKSLHAGALIKLLSGKKKLGYGVDDRGVIIPLNKEAEYNYRLGLDDHLKFRVNQKPNTQLLAEALGLNYRRDEYVLPLTKEEYLFCSAYKKEQRMNESRIIVGLNTGCSMLYPNKKMTVDQHVVLINKLSEIKDVRIALLGGPEDTQRNAEISRQVGSKALNTPTTEGVRRGVCYENICDVIVSGDSFGMHVGIALKKYVIVWFGVSCPQEIDLFDRGVKFIPDGLICSPCWKKECPYNLECVQMIDLERIVEEIIHYKQGIHSQTVTAIS